MVNWKASESTERLFAAIIAAHPGLKLDYQGMAVMFGQGATYDSIEGRFRPYRKLADKLKSEAAARGVTHAPRGRNSAVSTPRTPRGTRAATGVTKPSSSSKSGKGKDTSLAVAVATPSKSGKKKAESIMDAISIKDEDSEMDIKSEKSATISACGSGLETIESFDTVKGKGKGNGNGMSSSPEKPEDEIEDGNIALCSYIASTTPFKSFSAPFVRAELMGQRRLPLPDELGPPYPSEDDAYAHGSFDNGGDCDEDEDFA